MKKCVLSFLITIFFTPIIFSQNLNEKYLFTIGIKSDQMLSQGIMGDEFKRGFGLCTALSYNWTDFSIKLFNLDFYGSTNELHDSKAQCTIWNMSALLSEIGYNIFTRDKFNAYLSVGWNANYMHFEQTKGYSFSWAVPISAGVQYAFSEKHFVEFRISPYKIFRNQLGYQNGLEFKLLLGLLKQ